MMQVLGMLGPQMFDDRGWNLPETVDTLHAQQRQLIEHLRPAQMFPLNTRELPLPDGFERVSTERGVFHFNPDLVSCADVCRLSAAKRENELLALGPFSKADVLERVNAGEEILVVTERTRDGTEVRAALGTHCTAPIQIVFFERSKLSGSVIAIEPLLDVLMTRSES